MVSPHFRRSLSRLTWVVLTIAVAAPMFAVPSASSLDPKQIMSRSGEYFLTIYGSGMSDTSTTTLSGPAGTFSLETSASDKGSIVIWIPQEVVNKAGSYKVTVSERDGSSDPLTLDVIGRSPFITVPKDIFVLPDDRFGSYVKYDASATDSKGGRLDLQCLPKSGDLFGVGRTSVNCTATDAYDSVDSADFGITVKDVYGPQITTPGDMQVASRSKDGMNVSYDVWSYDFTDGDVPVSCKPFSGDFFTVGTTVVDCYAVDADRNETKASFTVTVYVP
jgi:hypothetical protein